MQCSCIIIHISDFHKGYGSCSQPRVKYSPTDDDTCKPTASEVTLSVFLPLATYLVNHLVQLLAYLHTA